MKYNKGITLVVLLFFVCAAFVPATSADRDSLKVIIFTENTEFKAGENITVEVRVYDAGELTEADELEVTVQTHRYGDRKFIDMEEISAGVYRGGYQIEDEDYQLFFSAWASSGPDDDEAGLYADVYEGRLELDIHFSHQSEAILWPGESARATITTSYRDEPVDVDFFRYVRLADSEDNEVELVYDRVSEGVYETEVEIQEDITENIEFRLEAYGEYANAHAQSYASVVVNVLTVWYRLEEVVGNTATFTIGVADSKGKSVSNAEVQINYPYNERKYTDEDGLALFSLTGIHSGTSVMGHVEIGELTQEFEGEIYIEDPEEQEVPDHDGFDVIYTGDDFMYSAGSKVSRDYKAYNNSIPLSNAEIIYYITLVETEFILSEEYIPHDYSDYLTTSKIIKTGTASTSLLGNFKISFTAPSKQGLVAIHFESGIEQNDYNYDPPLETDHDHDDDLVYEEDYDFIFINKGNLWDSSSVKINSDPLKVGGKTTVSVTLDEEPSGNDELFAKWMAGTPTSSLYRDELDSEWIPWVEGGNTIFLEETKNPREYEGKSIIPEFMEDGGDYTLVAGEMDGDSGIPYANHATIKEGESAGDSNMDILILILLGGAVLIILIILGFGAFNEREKKKEESSYKYPGAPGEGSGSPPPEQSYDSGQAPLNPELAALSQAADMPPPEAQGPPVEPEKHVTKSEDAREGADK
jgi:hypothetical protein